MVISKRTDTFRKFLILVRCLLFALVRGSAKKGVSDIKRVVIMQLAQMGDMVCTTPMFRAVKRTYPEARLMVIGNKINRETLEGNSDVDDYVIWDDQLENLIPILKKFEADFGCVVTPNFPSLALLYLAGVKTIAVPRIVNGWSPYETRPYRLLRSLVFQVEHRMRHYAPREYLRLLEPLGITSADTTKYVFSSKEGTLRAKKMADTLSQYPRSVVILPGAGNKIKMWPPERFGAVANYLIDTYDAGIFICGLHDVRGEADIIVRTIRRKDHVVDFIGKMTVDETKAFYAFVDLVVAVDTGPMFFAEARGTATVDIAGNIDENEQAPNDGKLHLVVVPPHRGTPEVLTMNAKAINYERAKKQIDSVTVPMVTDVIDVIMPRLQIPSQKNPS